VINKKTGKEYALKEVVQDVKYKNRELAIISQLDHPNIIEMKDYYFKIVEGECILHILMEYMDTSLSTLLKGQRKLKQPVSLIYRKLMAFQLFKGLCYLSVTSLRISLIAFATETSNLQISS
jgi:kinase